MTTTYIHYSGPTSDTGVKLAEALKTDHERKLPTTEYDIYIGWGAKTKEPVAVKAKKIINHPDSIRVNRNKYSALMKMQEAGVRVEDFCAEGEVNEALASGKLRFPLVGRKNYHQGGKGFFIVVNRVTLAAARRSGAQYFQNFAEISDEYRVHIIGGKPVHVQKKVEAATDADSMKDRFAAQQFEKVQHRAERNGVEIDPKVADFILKRVTQPEAPDPIVKSNTRGWKFSNVKKYPEDIVTQSVAAVAALGLDFGAVDVGVLYDEDSKKKKRAIVIEVNTGPGLDGTGFDAYVRAFEEIIKREDGNKTTEKKETKTKTVAKPKAKSVDAKGALSLIKKLMKEAEGNEQETAALEAVLGRVLGD